MDPRTENDLLEGLAALNIEGRPKPEGGLLVSTGRGWLEVDAVQRATVSAWATEGLLRDAPGPGSSRTARMVVADRISGPAKDRLRDAGWGWLDRRGHLRLWAPRKGLHIDASIPPSGAGRADYEEPLETHVGLEVAVALLLEPAAPRSIRALAHELKRAPSAVSTTLKRLRETGLVTADVRPLVPELFEEVSHRWSPRRVPLARAPQPGDASGLERLQFRIDDPTASGWALTDTLAAHHYGAPVVVGSAYPPDFYVPSEQVLRDAAAHFGLAPSYEARGCTVSVPPVPAAVTARVDVGDVADTELLLSRPLFVALELARDRARGREILDRWEPPEGWARVW